MATAAGEAQGLEALAAEARRDFERMLFPAANWVPPVEAPDGQPALDVLVIGGGMCGQTAAFALARDGVRNGRSHGRRAGNRLFWRDGRSVPVSYTHLTLPTIYSV